MKKLKLIYNARYVKQAIDIMGKNVHFLKVQIGYLHYSLSRMKPLGRYSA